MTTLGTLYGYAASIVACVAFGSFAVPIKSEAARRIDVDPLGTSNCLQSFVFRRILFVLWKVSHSLYCIVALLRSLFVGAL
jgi:hypothetical protein